MTKPKKKPKPTKETRLKPINEMTLNELTAELTSLRAANPTPPSGPRAVYVVDRGWIFAGDATEAPDGYVRLDDAVWVFRWETIGFAAMLRDWQSSKVDIRACDPVEVPKASIVFRVPVEAGWGKK